MVSNGVNALGVQNRLEKTRYRRLVCSGLTWCFYRDLRKQMWECDLFDGGVCKSFPPPLVRGGVFLVGLETKYRDIADSKHVSGG